MGGYINPQTGIPNQMALSSLFPGAGRMNAGAFGGQGGPMGGAPFMSTAPLFAAPQAPGGAGRLPMDAMMQAGNGPGSMTASTLAAGGGAPPFFPQGDRSMFAQQDQPGAPPFYPFPFPVPRTGGPSPPFNPSGTGMNPSGGVDPNPSDSIPPPTVGGYTGMSGNPNTGYLNPNDPGGPGPIGGTRATPFPRWTGPQTPVPEMSFSPEMNWETYRALTPEQQQHPAWQSFVQSQGRGGGTGGVGGVPGESGRYGGINPGGGVGGVGGIPGQSGRYGGINPGGGTARAQLPIDRMQQGIRRIQRGL